MQGVQSAPPLPPLRTLYSVSKTFDLRCAIVRRTKKETHSAANSDHLPASVFRLAQFFLFLILLTDFCLDNVFLLHVSSHKPCLCHRKRPIGYHENTATCTSPSNPVQWRSWRPSFCAYPCTPDNGKKSYAVPRF